MFGQILDFIINIGTTANSKRNQRVSLSENKRILDNLLEERQELINVGADPETIKSIDSTIVVIRHARVDLIAGSANKLFKKP